MPARKLPDQFLVAFSFAGEQRELVSAIAAAVEDKLGESSVFYDLWFEHYTAGQDGDLKLEEIYAKRSLLVVPCVSKAYADKPWTQGEHRAIRDLQMEVDASANDRDKLRVLPLRVGDGDVPGIFRNTICPDVRTKGIAYAVDLILNRL
jgi:hypothetical protein